MLKKLSLIICLVSSILLGRAQENTIIINYNYLISKANLNVFQNNSKKAFKIFKGIEKKNLVRLDFYERINFLNVCLFLNKKRIGKKQIIELVKEGGEIAHINKNLSASNKLNFYYKFDWLTKIEKNHLAKNLDYKLVSRVKEIAVVDQFVRSHAPHLMSYIDSIDFKKLISLRPLPSQHNIGPKLMSNCLAIILHYGRKGKAEANESLNILLKLFNNGSISVSSYTFLVDLLRTEYGTEPLYQLIMVENESEAFNNISSENKKRINENRLRLGMLSYEDYLLI